MTSAYFAETAHEIDVKHRTDPIFNLSIENNLNNRNAKKKKKKYAFGAVIKTITRVACCLFPGAAGVCCSLQH